MGTFTFNPQHHVFQLQAKQTRTPSSPSAHSPSLLSLSLRVCHPVVKPASPTCLVLLHPLVAAPPMLLASAVTSTSHTVSATAPTLPAVLMSPHPSSPTVLHTAPPLVLLLVVLLLLLVLMLAQPPLLLPPPPQLVPRPRPSPPDPRPSRPPSDHPPSLVLEVLLVVLLDLLVPLLLRSPAVLDLLPHPSDPPSPLASTASLLLAQAPQAPLLLLDPASPLLPHQLPPMQLPPTQPPPLPLVVLVKPPWPVWLVLSVSPPSSYKSTNQPDFSLRIRSISYSCLLHNTERKRNRKTFGWGCVIDLMDGLMDGIKRIPLLLFLVLIFCPEGSF